MFHSPRGAVGFSFCSKSRESEAQSRITRQPAIHWGICFDVFFCLADLLLLRNTVDVAEGSSWGSCRCRFSITMHWLRIDKSLGVDDCVAKRMMNFHRKCARALQSDARRTGLRMRPFFCTLAPLGTEFQVFIISAALRAHLNACMREQAHFNLRKIAFCSVRLRR